MKIRVIIVLTTLLFTTNLYSQTILSDAKRTEIGEITKELKISNNSFGFNLFAELYPQYDNIIISPFSIYSALLIAYAGSENETENEFEKIMFINNRLDYYKKYKFITEQYKTYLNTNRSEISVDNNIWLGPNIKLEPEYLNLIEYYSLLQNNQINYSNNLVDSRDEINEWIEDKTDGKITDLIEETEISDQARLIILNTLNFHSDWNHVFEMKRTQNNYFYNSNSDSVMVPFMYKYDQYGISENKNFTLIELPYYKSRSSMCILFPKDKLAEFSAENLKDIYDTLSNRLEKELFELALPKFNFNSHISLNQILISLGLEKAFDYRADFSGMTLSDVRIFNIIHESYIDVNEKGTSAGAATAIIYDCEKDLDSNRIIINKPFVFFIKDNLSDMILFMGKYSIAD